MSLKTLAPMLNPSKRVAVTVKCLTYKINYDRASLLAYYTHTKRDATPASAPSHRLPCIKSNGPQEF